MNNLRTNFALDNNKNYKEIKRTNNIIVLESIKNKYTHKTIKFNTIETKTEIKNLLKTEIKFFLPKNINHVLIIGLGNENNTADSVGTKTIKKVKVNFNINGINNIKKTKISCLEPGVLGTTGINTNKIIYSITKTINPDLVILIDSLVTNNTSHICKTIEITNKGITPGSGLISNNCEISKNTIKKPIITIGIPTALEYIDKNIPLLMTSSNIDYYVDNVSNIIATTLNELFQ